MPRDNYIFLHLLTYGTVIGLSYAVIGRNARTVRNNEFPFIVSISQIAPNNNYSRSQNLHLCTGTLISRRSVLTAAHYLIDKNSREFEVVAGSVDLRHGNKYPIEAWVTFHEFEYGRMENRSFIDDIAIITLLGQGIQNPHITPATLSLPGFRDLDDTRIQIAGWGQTESGRRATKVRVGTLLVLPNAQCSALATRLKGEEYIMSPKFFCSRSDPWILSSHGDGGGPVMLTRQHEVVGINIGVFPVITESNHTVEYLRNHQLNSHLRLDHYEGFISTFNIL